MAAPTGDKAVNGNHANPQGYGHPESYQSGQVADPAQSNAFVEQNHAAAAAAPPPTASTTEEEKPIGKEMIGWYFVEQYYNTMSKEPHKLYLYYTKKSQLVAGNEAEKVDVAVGQRAISERIKQLDKQDCKVRVSNVDSQESAKEILVQVIGEMSNRAAPHRKFVQTFVLAEQPTGYYVLNDIFRYILEEEEEEEEELVANAEPEQPTAPAQTEEVPATLTSSNDPVQQQHDAETVDRKLEQKVLSKSDEDVAASVASTNGVPPAETPVVKQADDAPVAAVKEPAAPVEEQATASIAAEDMVQAEKPRDPDPTPIASPPKPAKATPVEKPAAAIPKPAAPKTWANLVASKGASTNAGPAAAAATATTNGRGPVPATAPFKPRTGNASPEKAAAPSSSGTEEAPSKPQQNGNSGWQMARADSKQRQGRQHSQSMSSNQENVYGYVKNVTEKVDAHLLKKTLEEFGPLPYFDVSRQKNCAFVEFVTAAAYNACVAANPHDIGGEQVFVEERRPRNTAYGGNFNNRGGMRGNRLGPNERPGSQGRGGFKGDPGRGGAYGPRGRGGAMTPRGRGGQPQAA